MTRDRLSAEAEWCGRRFIVTDTGGIDVDGELLGRHLDNLSYAVARLSNLDSSLVEKREQLLAKLST